MGIKPLAGLTEKLRLFLKINIAVASVAVFAGFYQYSSYDSLPSGADASEILLPSDIISAIVYLTQFITIAVLGITFLVWIYRTNKNLHELTGDRMAFTPGWSIAWYFIPIANLFKPYQAMREIWEVVHRRQWVSLSILRWWWALWLTSNFFDHLSIKLALHADNAAGEATSALIDSAGDVVRVALSIVALALVTRIGASYAEIIFEQGAALAGDAAQPGQGHN